MDTDVIKEAEMNLYLKQKLFTIKDKFTVYDENENPIYTIKGKLITVHSEHSIFDNKGQEVAKVHKKIFSMMPKFFIERPLNREYELKRKIAIGHEVYVVDGLDWKIKGNFLEHDYTITKDDQEIASVHQKWLSWGDTYEISIAGGIDDVLILGIVLCIDIMHYIEGGTTATATEDLIVDTITNNNK